jgi:protein-S-isoprenylcysteine O-methyltransferase Ste14
MKKSPWSKSGVKPSPEEAPAQDQEGLITSSLPGWAGLVALIVGFFLLKNTDHQPWEICALIMGLMFAVMAPIEAWQSRRFKTGIAWNPTRKPRGLLQKLLGLAVTVGALGSLYTVFPEYSGDFYGPFYAALKAYWPWLVGFFVVTTWTESIKEEDPTKDPNYRIGQAILSLVGPSLSKEEWKNHILSWVIKLYFLPLMFIYMHNYVQKLSGVQWTGQPFNAYNIIYDSLFFVDTAFVCVGYAFANKVAGTQIRSAEKTAAGWLSALICYQPFWSVIGKGYISYGQDFGNVLSNASNVQWFYCSLIILAIVPYIWATISFGSRFSNLTHRGILFTGPYRYMRHPAYVFKLIAYFLMFTPFIAGSMHQLWANAVMFGLLCFVYRVRALTEENNLRSMGPEYDLYCKKVAENRSNLSYKILG